jgi:hypothetical protein
MEVEPGSVAALREAFAGLPLAEIGRTVADGDRLRASVGGKLCLDEPLPELKSIWKSGLARWY